MGKIISLSMDAYTRFFSFKVVKVIIEINPFCTETRNCEGFFGMPVIVEVIPIS